MNRRGFFSKLKYFLGDRTPSEVFFFGVQVVMSVYAKDNLRHELHRVISEGVAEEERPAQKRAFYKNIAALLLECQPSFDYGYWDYLTDRNDAEAEFQQWVTEIEGSMATEEEQMGEQIDELHRLSSEKYFVVVTFAFLFESSPGLEQFMTMIEEIPEEEYFSRATFGTLIDAVNYLDFEYCLSDGVFIMPGNEEDGFSWEDLHGGGWEYLKPIA
jgi:hypothetical protein